MNTKISEIICELEKSIKDFSFEIKIDEVGSVLSITDGIILCSGLRNVQEGEVVSFPDGTRGVVIDLNNDSVGVMALNKSFQINQGDVVKRTQQSLEVPVGKALVGRAINALGEPIDGKGQISLKEMRKVEVRAPGIINRESVSEPVITGVKVVDSLIPIGRGQRELIIGDRQIGKTSIAIDAIINQKRYNDHLSEKDKLYCIYVAIGQKQSSVARIHDLLLKNGAMDYTIILSESASSSASLQFIAPYAGCTIGEYFRDNGMHALIIYDDLSKHAVSYRQISLLLRRPPGREAYPGDIFYIHSKLLERAAKIRKSEGGGSLTALPIIETQEGDISSYIPTNVISITDGQIFLESDLFREGNRPAINIGLSVSRVGSAAQSKLIKSMTGSLKLDMSQFKELEDFASFGSDIDASTRNVLEKGKRLQILLNQDNNSPLSVSEQFVSIFIGINNFADKIKISFVKSFEKFVLTELQKSDAKFLSELEKISEVSDQIKSQLSKKLDHYLHLFFTEYPNAKEQVQKEKAPDKKSSDEKLSDKKLSKNDKELKEKPFNEMPSEEDDQKQFKEDK